MVNITYFIVKEVRNYDCGPWLLYNLAEKSKRYFTKKRITVCQKIYLHSLAVVVQELVALKDTNLTVVVLFCFVSNISQDSLTVINVLVFNANNILGARHTLI